MFLSPLVFIAIGVDPAAVEKAALDARLQIKTMFVRLKVNGEEYPGPHPADEIAEYRIWLDGTKIRGDILRTKGPNAGTRFIDCLNCEREGWGIAANDVSNWAASIHPIGAKGRDTFDYAIDPRVLGFGALPFVMLRNQRLDAIVGSADRSGLTTTEEGLNGTPCQVIRWTNRAKASVAVWISPTQGHSVVRIDSSLGEGAKAHRWLLDSAVAPIEKTNIWFPKLTKYQHWIGKELKSREEIEVAEVRVNEPIPPVTFTLAGMNLPEGKPIHYPDSSKSGYWVNGKVDTTPQRTRFVDTTPAEAKPVEPVEKGTNYWLVAACIVCALGAVVVLVFRRRNAPPN